MDRKQRMNPTRAPWGQLDDEEPISRTTVPAASRQGARSNSQPCSEQLSHRDNMRGGAGASNSKQQKTLPQQQKTNSLQLTSDSNRRGGNRGRNTPSFSNRSNRNRGENFVGARSNDNHVRNLEYRIDPKPMRFYELQQLILKKPNEILLTLHTMKKSEFGLLLESKDIGRDMMANILIAICKAVSSSLRNVVADMINTVSSSDQFFLINIQNYLASFQTYESQDLHLRSIEALIGFFQTFRTYLPTNTFERFQIVGPLLKATCTRLVDKCLLNNTVITLLNEIEEENEHLSKRFSKPNEIKHASQKEKVQCRAPPENYRSVPTLPTSEDVLQSCAFLRPNVVEGRYQDTEHYLDVQYRLLREDYVRPLRDGISEYLRLKKSGKTPKNCRDVRVYCDVHIVKQELARGGLVHVALFKDEKFAKIKWEFSKRFLTGSLLCLSSDNFETMLFASVVNRDPKELSKGLLLLQFEDLTDEVLSVSPLRNFDVIETTAYFEAYRYNLNALHELNEERLPMKRYIVEVQNNVKKPEYLSAVTTYDMRPLLIPMDETHIKRAVNKNGDVNTTYDFPTNISTKSRHINVLNDNSWPSCSELSLDPSQFAALKAAVTKEFAVIQGPPGTGKTFVGLRIAQLLLHNISKWQFEEDHSPILVVCYTNHALDQFLEGLLLFTQRIVRVGGRGSNEALAKFQLNNLKRVIAERRAVPNHIYRSLRQKNYELKQLKAEIDGVRKSLEKSLTSVLPESTLSEAIPEVHLASLRMVTRYLHDDGCLIYDWLNTRVRSSDSDGRGDSFNNSVFSSDPRTVSLETNREVITVEDDQDNEEDEDIGGEGDVEFIEAQRDINSEDFAGVTFDMPQEEKEDDLLPDNENGWQVQGGKKKRKQYISNWLRYSVPIPKERAVVIRDVWNLHLPDRWGLYKFWLQEFSEEKQRESFDMQQNLRKEYKELCDMRTEEDLHICSNAHVVGMTTTGAAKYRSIVQQLNPKILIVEEAAEILESHIVTSLAPNTQHVILIGDHQQLRPSPTVHHLAVKFGLNVSLFERMVQNGLECHRLGIQHRMRPDIAALLVPHIYENLENHDSVTKYENIKGVSKNMFFLTHSIVELAESDSKSKVNQHEARFMYRLCKYFVLQGYDPSEITVLTTYSGQLFELKRLVRKGGLLQKVRFTVVDNFQGEESKIVLMSLVRSNEEGQIGFLKVSNRVCVALSRAKEGLFCIGNFELLAENSDLWKNIVGVLHEKQAIGPSLQLTCQNHPGVSNVVTTDKDFDSVPEGGCNRSCEFRLDCGHVCSLMCHPYDQGHLEVRCPKPCTKKCDHGHPCKLKCFQKCGPCKEKVDKRIDECGHVIKVECGNVIKVECSKRFDADILCTKPCDRTLNCGHTCSNKCSETCVIKCEKMVTTTSGVCGHEVNVKCYQRDDVDQLAKRCSRKCDAQLNCGHSCRGTCGSCHQGRLHSKCNQLCKRILVCGHECKSPCSKSCPPCRRKCENRCVHSRCPSTCGEPCAPCCEPCYWVCDHYSCGKLCFEPCDRPPCDHPCPIQLPCGHDCIGLCGEPCPQQCRVCNEQVVKAIFFGSEDEEGARFIHLEDCKKKCFFEAEGLARWMHDDSDKEIQMKSCPGCKTVVRRNLRFGDVVKNCLMDIEKVKRLTYGDKNNNMRLQRALLEELKIHTGADIEKCYQPLRNTLMSGKTRSVQEITTMENIINIVSSLQKLTTFSDAYRKDHASYSLVRRAFELPRLDDQNANTDPAIKTYLNNLSNFVCDTKKWLVEFIKDDYLTASEQQLHELTWEVHRLKLADKLLQFVSERQYLTSNVHLTRLIDCLVTNSSFREKNVDLFTAEFRELIKVCGDAVINVSNLEKESIVKAIGLSKGHWYQCPNGHVYCIGECGGAMQQSHCNECGAPIGGTSHSLHPTNRVATAMDGASHGAWTDAMNMNNYNF